MKEERPDSLIAELQRLDGIACAGCGQRLCGHQILFNFAMGFKSVPRCIGCLSKALDREQRELHDYLVTYIHQRSCYRAAWDWTGSREGACPSAPHRKVPVSLLSAGTHEAKVKADAEWNAGEMGCGDLMLELRIRVQSLKPGQVLKVVAADLGAPEDMPAWCSLTGNTLVYAKHPIYFIRRKEA